jgi:hypothetical protein
MLKQGPKQYVQKKVTVQPHEIIKGWGDSSELEWFLNMHEAPGSTLATQK